MSVHRKNSRPSLSLFLFSPSSSRAIYTGISLLYETRLVDFPKGYITRGYISVSRAREQSIINYSIFRVPLSLSLSLRNEMNINVYTNWSQREIDIYIESWDAIFFLNYWPLKVRSFVSAPRGGNPRPAEDKIDYKEESLPPLPLSLFLLLSHSFNDDILDSSGGRRRRWRGWGLTFKRGEGLRIRLAGCLEWNEERRNRRRRRRRGKKRRERRGAVDTVTWRLRFLRALH